MQTGWLKKYFININVKKIPRFNQISINLKGNQGLFLFIRVLTNTSKFSVEEIAFRDGQEDEEKLKQRPD